MKLEIFDEKKIDEPVMHLRLHQDKDSAVIDLVAVSENGKIEQWLLNIQPDGSITRSTLSTDFVERYNFSVDGRYKMMVHE
jgi:hypothetical protein